MSTNDYVPAEQKLALQVDDHTGIGVMLQVVRGPPDTTAFPLSHAFPHLCLLPFGPDLSTCHCH